MQAHIQTHTGRHTKTHTERIHCQTQANTEDAWAHTHRPMQARAGVRQAQGHGILEAAWGWATSSPGLQGSSGLARSRAASHGCRAQGKVVTAPRTGPCPACVSPSFFLSFHKLPPGSPPPSHSPSARGQAVPGRDPADPTPVSPSDPLSCVSQGMCPPSHSSDQGTRRPSFPSPGPAWLPYHSSNAPSKGPLVVSCPRCGTRTQAMENSALVSPPSPQGSPAGAGVIMLLLQLRRPQVRDT